MFGLLVSETGLGRDQCPAVPFVAIAQFGGLREAVGSCVEISAPHVGNAQIALKAKVIRRKACSSVEIVDRFLCFAALQKDVAKQSVGIRVVRVGFDSLSQCVDRFLEVTKPVEGESKVEK